MACVYKIFNLLNGKFYIGSTTDLPRRKSQHLARLRAGKHHCTHLQNAWNRDGEISFSFEILEHCAKAEREDLEQSYIDRLDACNPEVGYNKARKVGQVMGFPHTKESREAMSRARRGVKTPNKVKAWKALGESMRGRKRPLDVVDKIRKANLGQKRSEETKARLRQINLGRKHSAEAVKKIREASAGRRHSDETKEKCRVWQIGVPKPREQVEKQRAALKGRFLGAERYNAKSVVQLTLEGSVLAVYESGATAARETGCHNSLITKVIRGKLKQTGGFIWRRSEQLTDEQMAQLNELCFRDDKHDREAA